MWYLYLPTSAKWLCFYFGRIAPGPIPKVFGARLHNLRTLRVGNNMLTGETLLVPQDGVAEGNNISRLRICLVEQAPPQANETDGQTCPRRNSLKQNETDRNTCTRTHARMYARTNTNTYHRHTHTFHSSQHFVSVRICLLPVCLSLMT